MILFFLIGGVVVNGDQCGACFVVSSRVSLQRATGVTRGEWWRLVC